MSDSNEPTIEPDDVIDAADDDLVDIDGAPSNPLAAVLGGGGFDLGALMEQASAMQSQMMEAQQHAADTVLEGVAGGGVVKVTITGAFEPQSVTIDPAAVDPSDVEMLQDLVLAALRHAVDQANDLQRGALGGGIELPDLGGMFGN
ncbi:MAG: YbaB/EbfC family nucleoid-associated protein [Acidimicrobiales bacterium]|nr:YbaB/EbfC family nucleoid-associated protein [Acidimicrobiales bacterium]